MNEFFEFFKRLFGLSEEQVKKAEEELKNVQKSDVDTEEVVETEDLSDKETKTEENAVVVGKTEDSKNTESVDDIVKSAGATPNKENKEGENAVNKEDYEKLQKELADMKLLLEQTKSEREIEKRNAKIQSIKDCVDYDLLNTLLKDVEEKDIDSKIDEIKKEKGYLFKSPETEGFNPATPQNELSGVEARFFELNPDLRV